MTLCPHCSAENEPGNLFCQNCGRPLTAAGSAAPQPDAMQPTAAMANVAAAAAPGNPYAYQPPAGNIPCAGVNPPVPSVPVVSTGNWLATILIWTLLPIVFYVAFFIFTAAGLPAWALISAVLAGGSELAFTFIMAFHRRVNPNKRTFFRAMLILYAIYLAVFIILIIVLSIFFAANLEALQSVDLSQLVNL